MSVLEGLLWTEKYRPTGFDDMALAEETRNLLTSYTEDGEIPHIALMGPPGTGKTTVAKILTDSLDCTVLTLNASSERGIDTVREKVRDFARSRQGTAWNIVFLDEADKLTGDAQTALRNLMETFADNCRFILTGNEPHRIIPAIRSRCMEIILSQTSQKERYRILAGVLDKEEIKYEPEQVFTYVETFTDLRQLLMQAQRSVRSHNRLMPARDMHVDGEQILEHVDAGRYGKLRDVASSPGFDPSHGLRMAFWAVPDDHKKAGQYRYVLAKAIKESTLAPDPVILFLGTCVELING